MNTEIFSQINWLAVLVAAIAYFILGALWYSKALFANKWIQAHAINTSDPNLRTGIGQMMFMSFLLFILICIGLAILIVKLDLREAISGVKIGLATGVCFAFTSVCIGYLYQKKPFAAHVIDGGFHIVGYIIASIILCMWR
jgi:uncharacterized protein DUF1761